MPSQHFTAQIFAGNERLNRLLDLAVLESPRAPAEASSAHQDCVNRSLSGLDQTCPLTFTSTPISSRFFRLHQSRAGLDHHLCESPQGTGNRWKKISNEQVTTLPLLAWGWQSSEAQSVHQNRPPQTEKF